MKKKIRAIQYGVGPIGASIAKFVEKNPGKLKASGTGQGGIWHLAIAGMLQDMKVDPASVPWVPSNGAAPAMQDLVGNQVDLMIVQVAEAVAQAQAGRLKAAPPATKSSSRRRLSGLQSSGDHEPWTSARRRSRCPPRSAAHRR